MRPPGFARDRARRLIESRKELLRVIEQAWGKLGSAGGARPLRRVVEELTTMLALGKAWARGEYGDVSRANLLLIVGAVVYFLMPFDLVPDFIVGTGFVDDAGVILWVVGAVRTELEKFRAWQGLRAPQNSEAAPASEAPQAS